MQNDDVIIINVRSPVRSPVRFLTFVVFNWLRRVHKDKRINKTNSLCKDFGTNTIRTKHRIYTKLLGERLICMRINM